MALVARLFKTGEAKLQQVKTKEHKATSSAQDSKKKTSRSRKNCSSKLVNRITKNNTREVLSSSFLMTLLFTTAKDVCFESFQKRRL